MLNLVIIDDFLSFIKKYKSVLFITLFFLLLGYGYFITTWSISPDSEFATFYPNERLLRQGRIIAPLFNALTNCWILPFFNNFIAIFLIFVSSLILAFTIGKIIRVEKASLLIFLLAYNINPIYAFYLQFTSLNIAIFFGMLLASLSIYNSSVIFLNKSRINTHILLSIVFLIIAILTYEMYAVYYLVGILFLVLLYKVFPYNIKCKYNKNTFRSICWTSFILAFSIIIYKILMYLVLILLNITKDNYTENYICWSKSNFINIIYSLVSYAFRLFTYNYNFYLSVTVLFGIIFMAFLSLKYRKKSLFLNFIVTLFLFSPFTLSIAFGNGGMPYRTLNALPLMLAGISFLYNHAKKPPSLLGG